MTNHDLAQAILRARYGSEDAFHIWWRWTPEQRDEAAEIAAHFKPAVERAIADISRWVERVTA